MGFFFSIVKNYCEDECCSEKKYIVDIKQGMVVHLRGNLNLPLSVISQTGVYYFSFLKDLCFPLFF